MNKIIFSETVMALFLAPQKILVYIFSLHFTILKSSAKSNRIFSSLILRNASINIFIKLKLHFQSNYQLIKKYQQCFLYDCNCFASMLFRIFTSMLLKNQLVFCISFVSIVAKSCPTLATLQTVPWQAPQSMGFSRQEYWSGLPFPSLVSFVLALKAA